VRSRRSTTEGQNRGSRPRGSAARRPRESQGASHGPQTAPTPRPAERPARPKTTSQAKARAKARKAKAPKIVRPPLRDRLLARLSEFEFRPQALIAKVPFVVLIIGSLGVGLGVTLWLSTDAAQRSYQLSGARNTNAALSQQKEALERDVLTADSAPALADAARNLGMIPSRDTAHLVQDPTGNWVVVGNPKAAEGAPPPPLNTKLPDDKPAPPGPKPAPAAPAPGAGAEVSTRVALGSAPGIPLAVPGAPGPEVAVRLPAPTDPTQHLPLAAAAPGPVPGSAPAVGGTPPAVLPQAADAVPPAPAVLPAPQPLPPVSPTTGLLPATNDSLANLPPVPPVLSPADLPAAGAAQ
jgi:hypothetical protein